MLPNIAALEIWENSQENEICNFYLKDCDHGVSF